VVIVPGEPTSLPATDAAVIEQSWAEPERFEAIFRRYFSQIHQYLAARVGAGSPTIWPRRYSRSRLLSASGMTWPAVVPARGCTGSPRTWPIISGLALSGDGSKLAVSLWPARGQTGSKIQVFSLATGAGQEWAWPGQGAIGQLSPRCEQRLAVVGGE
jgi:hypothetical protein